MSLHSTIALATALLYHADFIAAGVGKNLGFNSNSRNVRRTDGHRGILREKKHLVKYELCTSLLADARDAELLPLRDLLLKALDVHNGEHVRESVEIVLGRRKRNSP